MRIYRIGAARHARQLNGAGASMYPGRWNSLGVRMVYCGGNPATCLAEQLVRLTEAPDDYVLTTIEVPDDAPVLTPATRELPAGWDHRDTNPGVQAFGDAFIRTGRHLTMRVPSVVVPVESNYLLNPDHPDMARVRIIAVEPFTFDPRLF